MGEGCLKPLSSTPWTSALLGFASVRLSPTTRLKGERILVYKIYSFYASQILIFPKRITILANR